MNCPKCNAELRYSKIDSACYLCHQCHEAYPVAAIERISELEADLEKWRNCCRVQNDMLMRMPDAAKKVRELEAENLRRQSVIRLFRIALGVDGTVEEFNAFEKALEGSE